MKPAMIYFRVNTERQGRSGFGLAQSTTLLMWLIGIAVPFALALQEAAISVPCVDDYSFAGVVATHGLPAAIHNEYVGWSGRFLSYTLEFSLTYFIWISWAYPVFVTLILLSALALDYIGIRALFRVSRLQALLLALSFETIRLCLTTDLTETPFWLTGAVDNFLPISAYFCLIAITCRLLAEQRTPSPLQLIALAVSAFAAAGFHELYASFFVASLFALTATSWLRFRRPPLWCVVVLVAAAGGLAVVVTAPGNAGRLSVEPKGFDRLAALTDAFETIAPRIFTVQNAALVLAAAALFATQTKIGVREGVARLIDAKWAALFIAACFLGMACTPILLVKLLPFRTFDALVCMVLFGSFVCLGLITARHAGLSRLSDAHPWIPALLAVVFCTSILSAPNIADLFHDAVFVSGPFRHEYATRFKLLRAASAHPGAHVTLAPFMIRPRATLFDDITTDPSDGANQGVAQYYGLAEVVLGDANRLRFETVQR